MEVWVGNGGQKKKNGICNQLRGIGLQEQGQTKAPTFGVGGNPDIKPILRAVNDHPYQPQAGCFGHPNAPDSNSQGLRPPNTEAGCLVEGSGLPLKAQEPLGMANTEPQANERFLPSFSQATATRVATKSQWRCAATCKRFRKAWFPKNQILEKGVVSKSKGWKGRSNDSLQEVVG